MSLPFAFWRHSNALSMAGWAKKWRESAPSRRPGAVCKPFYTPKSLISQSYFGACANVQRFSHIYKGEGRGKGNGSILSHGQVIGWQVIMCWQVPLSACRGGGAPPSNGGARKAVGSFQGDAQVGRRSAESAFSGVYAIFRGATNGS